MKTSQFEKISDTRWEIRPTGAMRVPAVIHASEQLIQAMDDKVREQLVNVSTLPGIVGAAHAMPDAHWGYGFPIGGVAAFDPNEDGVISAGGVGFDISCGVRTHLTSLQRSDINSVRKDLATALFDHVPAGLGSQGNISLDRRRMDAMLSDGARWALQEGYGEPGDLDYIEDHGRARMPCPAVCPRRPGNASSMKWAHSDPAIIILRSRKSPNCPILKRQAYSAWSKVHAWSPFTAGREAWVTR